MKKPLSLILGQFKILTKFPGYLFKFVEMKKSKIADRYQDFVVEFTDYQILENEDEYQKDPLNFAYLIKAKEKKGLKRIVAIHQLSEEDDDNSTDVSKSFLRELDFYVKVRSYIGIPNFYGYYFAPEKSLITEYLPNGSLSKIYNKLKKGGKQKYIDLWTDTFKAKLTFGIACTMMHLHAFNANHRYLRADVIFFDEEYNPKVTEFALSKIQIGEGKVSDFKLQINKHYASPEIIEGEPISTKSDVYSYGVLLLSIVQGNEDFKKEKADDSFKIPESGDNLKLVSSIIKNCTNKDPKKRPSFAQIVKALKDAQNLFPETDEEQYQIFVNRYMENVEVDKKDKPLLFGGSKSKRPTKKQDQSSKSSKGSSKRPKEKLNSSSSKLNSSDEEHISSKSSSKLGSSSKNRSSKKLIEEPVEEEDKDEVKSKKSSKSFKPGSSSSKNKSSTEIPDDEEEDEKVKSKKSSKSFKPGTSSSKNKSSTKISDDEEEDEEEKSKKSSKSFKPGTSSSKIKSRKESDEEEDEEEKSKKSSKNKSRKEPAEEEDEEEEKSKKSSKGSDDEDEKESSKKHINEGDEESDRLIEVDAGSDSDKESEPEFHSSYSDVIDVKSTTSSDNEEEEEDKRKPEKSDSDHSSDDDEVSFEFDKVQFKDVLAKANKGDACSMVQAGRMLQKGEYGAKKDIKKAFEMYQKAADAGNAIGLYNYAACKLNGIGCDEDEDEAYDAMKKAAQPGKKNPQAMETYGEWLLKKDSSKEGKKEALKYFLNAMKYGNSRATFNAAKIYESFNKKEEAKMYYLDAGELGILPAYNDYALLLLSDKSTTQDGLLALKQNAIRKCPESNYNLGVIELKAYKNYGLDPNIENGVKHIRSAAHAEHEKACFLYAKMLVNGENGVKKNLSKAAYYYRIAAKKGNTAAMVNLGILLQKDDIDGIDQDLEKAAEYFRIAADKGDKKAMEKYAQCLENGDGVEEDTDLAKEYRNKAKKAK